MVVFRGYGAGVNIDWMRQKLTNFLEICEEYDANQTIEYDKPTMKPIEAKIADALPTVEQVVRQLDPRLLSDRFGSADQFFGMSESSQQTRKALAILRDREEWKINLAPDSPSLTADHLHPTIWGAAASVWETGEYETAGACPRFAAGRAAIPVSVPRAVESFRSRSL